MIICLQIESGRIDFFPQRYALVLTDREAETTTDDLLKQVKMATHDLAEDITYQAHGTREVVVTRLNKKLALDDSEKDNASKQLEAELQKMKDEIKSMKDGVEKQICAVQQDLANKIAALSSTILERVPVKVSYAFY